MPVSNQTLMKIAAIGGFATASMGFALRSKLNKKLTQTEYYQEALNTLNAHKGAVHLLGNHIKACSVEVGNSKQNWTNNLDAHYEVPIYGTKQSGILYFWANRKSEAESWCVHRIELALSNEPDRRLLVKNQITN